MDKFFWLKQLTSQPGFRRLAGVALLLIPGSSVLLVLVAAFSFLVRHHAFRLTRFRRPAALLLMLTAILAAAPSMADEKDWQLVRRDSDLTVYDRDVPGSDVVALKFEGELAAPMDRVVSVILDYQRAVEWVDHLEESRLLRQVSETEFIEYNHIGTPFVLKDRDFVIRVRAQWSPVDRTLAIAEESTEDAAVPDSGYVRGNLMVSTFQVSAIDRQRTRISGVIQVDPMGSVPKWVVNLFQKQWPRTTFDRIQEQLKKANTGVPGEFRPLISEVREGLAGSRPF